MLRTLMSDAISAPLGRTRQVWICTPIRVWTLDNHRPELRVPVLVLRTRCSTGIIVDVQATGVCCHLLEYWSTRSVCIYCIHDTDIIYKCKNMKDEYVPKRHTPQSAHHTQTRDTSHQSSSTSTLLAFIPFLERRVMLVHGSVIQVAHWVLSILQTSRWRINQS